jgi:hypothetical protein
MRSTNHACVIGLVLALAAGCGDNVRLGLVLETRVAKQTVAAGERVGARCALLDTLGEPALDDAGKPLTATTELVISYAHEDSFTTDADGEVIATRVGKGTVRCSAPSLDLIDDEPEEIEIVAGAARRVVTQLASPSAMAGDAVGVSCLAFDAFNNPVTSFKQSVALSPSVAGATMGADSVTVTLAGEYTVSCVILGAADVQEDALIVVPAAPSSLSVALDPERTVYAIDDQVTVAPEARDRFGNRVDDITVSYSAVKTAPTPGDPQPFDARYQFASDGQYSLAATVTSQTSQDAPLDASVTVFVNSTGPAIECRRADTPAVAAEAYMIQAGPTTRIIPVRISATFEVQTVTMNGTTAAFNASTGNYEAGVPIGFGMNFIDVVARDRFGRENSTTCFVLAADSYTAENTTMPGAIAMRLDPAAIGDSLAGGLNSINDILTVVLNSSQLRDLVDAGILASNPISDGGCGLACDPDINYNGGTIQWNAPSSTLTLVPGGLQARVTLPNVKLRVRACGTLCCIGGSSIAVTVDQIVATLTFSLQLQGGVLRAGVVGSPSIAVGAVHLDASGFCGLIVSLLEDFFAGKARTAIRDALAGFVNSNVAPLLDQLVSSLDINTLGASIAVPRIDGPGSVGLQFGLQFTSFEATAARALLGIGTRFTPASVAHNRASLGIPRRTPNPLIDPPGTSGARSVGLGLYEGVLNEVLHGLWRGGFFVASLQLGFGSATIDARLPPVAMISGNQAQLTLGGIQATIQIPGIIDQPLQILFGGRATASFTLTGNALHFGNLTLTQLFVSFQTPLTQAQRTAMANLLTQILQTTLADAINNGLPAFPIPTFALPASVADFGLPAGAELGILNPQLATSGAHFVLTGSFGVRN